MRHLFKHISVVAFAMILAACGGGGDDPPPAAATATPTSTSTPTGTTPTPTPTAAPAVTIEGAYAGVAAGGAGSWRMLVLENSETHLGLGTNDSNGAFTPSAWIKGTTAVTGNGSFVTTFDGGRMQGTFDGNNLSGTLALDGSDQPIAITIAKSEVSGYDYNQPPQASSVTGNWRVATGAVITISPFNTGGRFSLTNGTCTATYTLTPRPSGKNLFNIATVGSGTCAGATGRGLALTYRDTANNQHLMMHLEVDDLDDSGVVIVARR